jgi:uncharacterized membrane protein
MKNHFKKFTLFCTIAGLFAVPLVLNFGLFGTLVIFFALGGAAAIGMAILEFRAQNIDGKVNNHQLASPRWNTDGTPMCGYLDINGNPYGVTTSIFESDR